MTTDPEPVTVWCVVDTFTDKPQIPSQADAARLASELNWDGGCERYTSRRYRLTPMEDADE